MIKMKSPLVLTILLNAVFMLSLNLNAQDDCKVLTEALQGEYTGDCKKGLAHGTGESKGIDIYRGDFKKGLPNGTGTYIWKNGNSYEGEFKDGKRNGISTDWYDSGQKRVVGNYDNGIGQLTFWYKSGQKQTFVDQGKRIRQRIGQRHIHKQIVPP